MATGLKVDDISLEKLIVQSLADVEQDMKDVDVNIDLYRAAMSTGTFALEQYGELYNEALKLKGSLRDRVLKIISLMKDRVKTKEVYAMTKRDGSEMSAEDIKTLRDKIAEDKDNE